MEEGHDESCPSTEPIARLNKLQSGEEIADLEGGSFRSVGAVRAIVADAGAEVVADGAGGRFLGIGGAHGITPFEDGAFGFENEREDFARAHEVGELAEEGALFMNGVEAAGFFFGQPHGLDGNDLEASLMNARKNFALLPAAYGVRLDDCKRAFE